MSKISFNLDKVIEKDNVGFYKVSGASITKNFYLGINKAKRILYIYLSDDFTKPIYTIDTTKDFLIKEENNIDSKILAPILSRGIEILNLDHFPAGISYAA